VQRTLAEPKHSCIACLHCVPSACRATCWLHVLACCLSVVRMRMPSDASVHIGRCSAVLRDTQQQHTWAMRRLDAKMHQKYGEHMATSRAVSRWFALWR
jgi:hypothetical protein